MRVVICFLIWAFSLGIAVADDSDYDVNLYVENDFKRMSIWDSDRSYSNGIRISFLYAPNELPAWAKNSSIGSRRNFPNFNWGLSVGHQIYTPEDLGRTDLIVDDQPYAGYFYTGLIFNAQRGRWLLGFELDLGFIGPPTLAAQIQRNYHGFFNMRDPRGWNNQLKTEPTANLFYQQKIRVLEWTTADGTRMADVIPYFGAGLGNVYIMTGAGLGVRFGYNISDDFGQNTLIPVGIDPFVQSTNGDGQPRVPRGFFGAYVFAGGEAQFVPRNIFLDGNTFQDSHRVEKNLLVYDAEMGVVVRVAAVRLMWRQVVRTKEFKLEKGNHAFASVGISYSYRF